MHENPDPDAQSDSAAQRIDRRRSLPLAGFRREVGVVDEYAVSAEPQPAPPVQIAPPDAAEEVPRICRQLVGDHDDDVGGLAASLGVAIAIE
jgi:hypothetical protein